MDFHGMASVNASRRSDGCAGISQRVRYRCAMKLTDEGTAGSNTIRSYAPGEVRIGEVVLKRSFLVSASQIVEDWRPRSIEDLEAGDLDAIFALEPEIVVLGVGERQRFPRPEWTGTLLARGIGCEVMDTGAASRTYKVL